VRPPVREATRDAAARARRVLGRLSPEWRDAVLYGASAIFAAVTALAVSIPLYRQWGQMAAGPYAAATAVAAFAGWRWSVSRSKSGEGPAERAGRRARAARIVAFLVVLFGATLVPLSIEVVWRSQGNAAEHVQPEVVVVERAGARVAHGKTPYQVIDRNGHILIHQGEVPVYELYYPYLPGMVIFGLSSGSTVEASLTDARIQFLVFTVLVSFFALSRLRPATDARTRAWQALTVLPTAALPFATGGDDMPVVALMLAGLVALQRRRPVLAGLALGAASSLKFTAWPLVVFALWAAFDRRSRRAVGRYAVGVAAIVVPVVFPVALSNVSAFVDNVIRFPLGLAGVSSPAASALPGHILVSALPGIHRPYLIVVGIVGGVVLVRHLLRHPPRDPAGVAALTGWVMLVAILLAPATRVGYLLYPINLFVWAWMLGQAEVPATGGTVEVDGGASSASAGDRAGETQFSSSGSWKSSTEYGVMPADVVGETTTPTSQ
jgi:MYXO-CTERM domain-containing protein